MDGAASIVGPRRILHVGCGGERLPSDVFDGVAETRLDISPDNSPDIVGSMCDMPMVADGEFDGIYSSHSLEHLYPHDAEKALSEFHRVLKSGAAAIIIVPDCEDARPTEDVLYECPCGPMTGLDLLYGYRRLLADMPYMAHRNAFTRDTLKYALERAGFTQIVTRRCPDYNLLAIAVKQ